VPAVATPEVAGPARVGFFGAKKTAEDALAETARLKEALAQERHERERLGRICEEKGLLEFDEIQSELSALRRTASRERSEWTAETQYTQGQLAALRSELAEAEKRLVGARNGAVLQDLGIYDYEHPAEHSSELAGRLERLRTRYKEMARTKSAIHATKNFTFDNSAVKGQKFVNQMSTIMLRAYNAEAENCVKSVKAGALSAAIARLVKARDQIEKQGTMIDLRVDEEYHSLRVQELTLAADHLQRVQAEKEAERAQRDELREQKKAEAELARAKEKLEKERAMHVSTMDALIANGDIEGAERMREKIAEDDLNLEDVERRAANMRAGFVYVISNVGAFGENMVKIGMTRRVVPMDRVDELGDASVPFRFDVHALFYSDDAVATENMLHKHFAEQRVNKVNTRREFFRVTPAEVLRALKEHNVELVEFTEQPLAEEYRLSLASA
jgi:hypothetical protein